MIALLSEHPSWGQIARSLGEHTTQSALYIEVIKALEIYLNRIRFVVQKAHGAALSIPECRTEKEIRERGKGAAAWEEEGLSERGWDVHALPLPVEGHRGLVQSLTDLLVWEG